MNVGRFDTRSERLGRQIVDRQFPVIAWTGINPLEQDDQQRQHQQAGMLSDRLEQGKKGRKREESRAIAPGIRFAVQGLCCLCESQAARCQAACFPARRHTTMTGPAALVCNSFENVTDPRKDRGHHHDLLEMIFLALTATICGADSWTDVERFGKAKIDWFRRYLDLKEGIPSHDTFGRVFSSLDGSEFLQP